MDAKAEDSEIGVGGWLPAIGADGNVDKFRSAWFAITLSVETAPWAFCQGQPYRTVSALELFGAIL